MSWRVWVLIVNYCDVLRQESGFSQFSFPKFPQLYPSLPFNSPFSSFPFLSSPKSMAQKTIYPHVNEENPFSIRHYFDVPGAHDTILKRIQSRLKG
jgi:hypothetical protein